MRWSWKYQLWHRREKVDARVTLTVRLDFLVQQVLLSWSISLFSCLCRSHWILSLSSFHSLLNSRYYHWCLHQSRWISSSSMQCYSSHSLLYHHWCLWIWSLDIVINLLDLILDNKCFSFQLHWLQLAPGEQDNAAPVLYLVGNCSLLLWKLSKWEWT